jgi:hypothetical protein
MGLSLVSLGGLIFLVGCCIIGLIELSALSNHWPIGLIGIIVLDLIASSASTAYLACWLISFVSLLGASIHQLFCERLTTAIIETIKISWQLMQAATLVWFKLGWLTLQHP